MTMLNTQFEGAENDSVAQDQIDAFVSRSRSRADTPEMVAFRAFFDTLDARHFTADEFMVLGPSHHASGGACEGKNTLAPRALWDNVVPLVRAMDAIRAELGAPITITNCFRSDAYNTCVGGVPGSFHRSFQAADWVCRTGTSAQWAAAAQRVRDSGAFSGGIGIYRSFVHVDVRGMTADWDNR